MPSTGTEQVQSEGVCLSGVHPGPGAADPDTRPVTPVTPAGPRAHLGGVLSAWAQGGLRLRAQLSRSQGVGTPQVRPATGRGPWGAVLGGSQQEGCLWSEACRGL